jgi:hypothetical protein
MVVEVVVVLGSLDGSALAGALVVGAVLVVVDTFPDVVTAGRLLVGSVESAARGAAVPFPDDAQAVTAPTTMPILHTVRITRWIRLLPLAINGSPASTGFSPSASSRVVPRRPEWRATGP